MSRFYSSSDLHQKQPPLTATKQQLQCSALNDRKQHNNSCKPKNTINQSVRGGSNSVVPRFPQPFQGGKAVHQHVSSSACSFVKSHSIKKQSSGFEQKTGTATGGTGVFLPVYCATVSRTRGDDLNNNRGMDEEEHQKRNCEEDVPIESLLPSEWTY